MADLLFRAAPNIVLGSLISSRLGLYAKEWGERFMVIVDPGLKRVQKADTIFESLSTRNVDYFVFDEIDPSSDSETVRHALGLARDARAQGVIAVGGSSVQGVARSVCALFHEKQEIYSFFDGESPSTESLPLIAVPSTIRSHFLFTDVVPVVDARSRQLKVMKVQNALCKLAAFDPNLHLSLSADQTGSITLETLGIAVEAYLSQKANFFSDMFAERAMELLGWYLNPSEGSRPSAEPETLLAQGGCLASLAVASSSVGPAALAGLAVSARYKVPRPLTASILLPYVLEDVAKFKKDRVVRVAQLMGIEGDAADDDRMVSLLAGKIRNLIALARLPSHLKDLSLTMEQFAIAAEDVSQLEMVNGMPRSMGSEDFFELMKTAF